jgi:hypothetical protein
MPHRSRPLRPQPCLDRIFAEFGDGRRQDFVLDELVFA